MGDHARQRISRRDRPWVDAYVSMVCGPFDMPSLEQLRWAVEELAARYPHSRLRWGIDAKRKHWTADRDPSTIVVERDWDGVNVGQRLDLIAADESLPSPLTLIRYPRHIGMKMSHALGDGQAFLMTIGGVLSTAASRTAVPWPPAGGSRWPVVSAALATFGRRPQLIASAVADRVAPPTGEPTGTPTPWRPARHTIHTSVPPQHSAELMAWKQTNAPQASRFALQVSLVLKALALVGLAVSHDVRIIVDLRRYLGGRPVSGNFLAGVPTNMSSTTSPADISAMIRATALSGRPLAGYLQTSLRGMDATPEIDVVEAGALPRITFSNLGRAPVIETMPFCDDGPLVYSGSVPPEGPLGITVLASETRNTITLDLVFHDNVVSADLVRQAMELITTDPVGVMNA